LTPTGTRIAFESPVSRRYDRGIARDLDAGAISAITLAVRATERRCLREQRNRSSSTTDASARDNNTQWLFSPMKLSDFT